MRTVTVQSSVLSPSLLLHWLPENAVPGRSSGGRSTGATT